MFISISQIKNGRYTFCIGDDPTDEDGTYLFSYRDAALLGNTPTTFASFGEAHAVASRIIDERPSCVLAKKSMFYSKANDTDDHREIAEGDTVSHYIEQVELVGQRLALLNQADVKDFDVELGVVENEINGISEEVKNLIPLIDGVGLETFKEIQKRLDLFLKMVIKLKKSKKTVAATELANVSQMRKTVIRTFSEAAMKALQPNHKDVFIKGAYFLPETESCKSVLATKNGDLVHLLFDKNLLLSNIKPCGQSLKECGGTYSNSFFLKYWEPIVNAIGHFHSSANSIVAVPEMDNSKRDLLKSFSTLDGSECVLKVTRPIIMGKKTWLLNKTSATVVNPPQSEMTVDQEVECIAKHLPTYFGRTGCITEVSSQPEKTLYRVDFRRGIGVVWLEQDDIRKVQLVK